LLLAYSIAICGSLGCALAYFVFLKQIEQTKKEGEIYVQTIAEAQDYTV
jgi:hypothetical protein